MSPTPQSPVEAARCRLALNEDLQDVALVLLVHGESADAAHLVLNLRQGTLAASRRAAGCLSPGVCARPAGDPAEGHRSYHVSAAASPELHLVVTLASEDPDDATEYVYLDAG